MMKVYLQCGLRRHLEDFEIVGYGLGKDHWTEGYVTMVGDQVFEDESQWN
jgi:RimJ/RimL family protein N-acetyltransferase